MKNSWNCNSTYNWNKRFQSTQLWQQKHYDAHNTSEFWHCLKTRYGSKDTLIKNDNYTISKITCFMRNGGGGGESTLSAQYFVQVVKQGKKSYQRREHFNICQTNEHDNHKSISAVLGMHTHTHTHTYTTNTHMTSIHYTALTVCKQYIRWKFRFHFPGYTEVEHKPESLIHYPSPLRNLPSWNNCSFWLGNDFQAIFCMYRGPLFRSTAA